MVGTNQAEYAGPNSVVCYGSPPDERRPLPARLDLKVLRIKRVLNRTLDFESPKLRVDRSYRRRGRDDRV